MSEAHERERGDVGPGLRSDEPKRKNPFGRDGRRGSGCSALSDQSDRELTSPLAGARTEPRPDATAGTYAEEKTGRTESDPDGVDTSNGWTAPTEIGPTRLWVVLRDDRGGVGWSEYVIQGER